MTAETWVRCLSLRRERAIQERDRVTIADASHLSDVQQITPIQILQIPQCDVSISWRSRQPWMLMLYAVLDLNTCHGQVNTTLRGKEMPHEVNGPDIWQIHVQCNIIWSKQLSVSYIRGVWTLLQKVTVDSMYHSCRAAGTIMHSTKYHKIKYLTP